MKRRHHTPEQINRKLEEGDKLLAQGKSVEEVCRGTWIEERFGISERRVCKVVGQARSTQPPAPPVPTDDELRAFLRACAVERPRWAWRRALVAARGAGFRVNHKKRG